MLRIGLNPSGNVTVSGTVVEFSAWVDKIRDQILTRYGLEEGHRMIATLTFEEAVKIEMGLDLKATGS